MVKESIYAPDFLILRQDALIVKGKKTLLTIKYSEIARLAIGVFKKRGWRYIPADEVRPDSRGFLLIVDTQGERHQIHLLRYKGEEEAGELYLRLKEKCRQMKAEGIVY